MKFMNNIRVAVLLIIIVSCQKQNSNGLEFPFEKIKLQVEKTISNKNELIDINDFISFDWDKLYVFKPYSTSSIIDKELGFSWKDVKDTGISQNDSYCLLVFIKEGEIEKYLNWPRSKGDFSKLERVSYLKDESIFNIKKEKQGEQDWLFFENR